MNRWSVANTHILLVSRDDKEVPEDKVASSDEEVDEDQDVSNNDE
jgi:hypothetical protein